MLHGGRARARPLIRQGLVALDRIVLLVGHGYVLLMWLCLLLALHHSHAPICLLGVSELGVVLVELCLLVGVGLLGLHLGLLLLVRSLLVGVCSLVRVGVA